MFKDLFFLVKSEVTYYIKNSGLLFNSFAFMIIANSLFIFALGPDISTLNKLGPSLILVVFFLSSNLIAQNIITKDYLDGTLELLLILKPTYYVISSKIISLILIMLIPAVISIPFISIMFYLNFTMIIVLICTIILTSFTLSTINILGNILTIKSTRGSFINLLISIPFMIILIIFASSSFELFNVNNNINVLFTPFVCLISLFLILFPITNFFGNFALKEMLV